MAFSFFKKKPVDTAAAPQTPAVGATPRRGGVHLPRALKRATPQKPRTERRVTLAAVVPGRAARVLLAPIVSEKATRLAEQGQYVFRVPAQAEKVEIRAAVEDVYRVHVTKVNILNVSGKMRRAGARQGRERSWRKAIVTVARGEKLSVFAQ